MHCARFAALHHGTIVALAVGNLLGIIGPWEPAGSSHHSVAERGHRIPENGSTEPNAGRRREQPANIDICPRAPARNRRLLHGQAKPMTCREFSVLGNQPRQPRFLLGLRIQLSARSWPLPFSATRGRSRPLYDLSPGLMRLGQRRFAAPACPQNLSPGALAFAYLAM